MKERFENRRLKGGIKIKMDADKGTWLGDKFTVVAHIVSIAEEYRKDGYSLTLRQLYYQLVARDIIPNHDKVYAKISSIKDDVVYSGLVDWDVFEDRGRIPSLAYFENSVEGALQRTIENYQLDRQRGQKIHIEVWTEKDAISSILKRATHQKTIRLVVNKGYTSSTAIYGAYERFLDEMNEGKKIKILYFGDHDPSGMDMIRDIKARVMLMLTKGSQFDNYFDERMENWWSREELDLFAIAQMEGYEEVAMLYDNSMDDETHEKHQSLFEEGRRKMYIEEHELFEIIHVGLTMKQIKEYNPPHNPAKMTDPRAKSYIAKYGQVSWEVDALKPAVMLQIVNTAIEEQMDMDQYDLIMEEEAEEKAELIKLLEDRK